MVYLLVQLALNTVCHVIRQLLINYMMMHLLFVVNVWKGFSCLNTNASGNVTIPAQLVPPVPQVFALLVWLVMLSLKP